MKNSKKLLMKFSYIVLGAIGFVLSFHLLPIQGANAGYNSLIDLNGNAFEREDFELCTSNNPKTCYTLMDRNLGAGTINSQGYLYQWGNNYGFSSGESIITGNQISCNIFNPLNPLNDSIFRVGFSDYCTEKNDNLRGGSGDSQANNWGFDTGRNTALNVTLRQGPCPTGYHIPSYGERVKVLKILGNTSNDSINYSNNSYNSFYSNFSNFLSNLKMSIGSYLYYTNGSLLSENTPKRPGKIININVWSSSPGYSFNMYYYTHEENYQGDTTSSKLNIKMNSSYKGNGYPIRCFKNPEPIYIEPTDDNFQATVGETVYNELPSTMTVTTNNEQQVNNKPVLGEVSVSFGSNESAKFSKLVKVNIPVENAEQVIIKVKHAGSSEYNYDGLTTNANASCNANGRSTSSQYNGEPITVVDGFASIYTCEASSFVALSVENGGDSLITVNIAALNNGQNTCTLDNYIFSGIFASPSVVFRNISQSMHCVFGNANESVVTLQLSGDLTDGSGNTISAGNVRLKNTAWTATPAAVQGASSAIGDYTSLNQTLTLFNKVANKIGEATGSAVDIQVEIPGGTPDGVYNGTLVLSY